MDIKCVKHPYVDATHYCIQCGFLCTADMKLEENSSHQISIITPQITALHKSVAILYHNITVINSIEKLKQSFITTTNSLTNSLKKEESLISSDLHHGFTQVFHENAKQAQEQMLNKINEYNADSIQQYTDEYNEKINQKIKQLVGLLQCKIQEPAQQSTQCEVNLANINIKGCTETAGISQI